jgi:hypothetical protein
MSELIEAVASPWNLVLIVIVFGFLPGFTLRALVRIYPPDDPRRHELVAQLYVLNRIERPLFVAEQLETVLFEGVGARLRRRQQNFRSHTQSGRPVTGVKRSDLFPHGRHIFYEGEDPDGFAQQITAEFAFDVTKDPRWGDRHPDFISYGFDCPSSLLDAIYGSDRFPMGS